MSKFSPGPWRMGDGTDLRDVHNGHVATIHGYARDARLIAAAPEMYELLRNLSDALESMIDEEYETFEKTNPGGQEEAVVAARALLARIDGSETEPE